jgi:hypothetical protein
MSFRASEHLARRRGEPPVATPGREEASLARQTRRHNVVRARAIALERKRWRPSGRSCFARALFSRWLLPRCAKPNLRSQKGAAGFAGEAAGLTRHPGRVASGGEADTEPSGPQTRRRRIFALCEKPRKRGPSAHDLPGAVTSPLFFASRPDPEEQIDARAERLEARNGSLFDLAANRVKPSRRPSF